MIATLTGFDYATYPQTPIPVCPVCGVANPSVPDTDRYGLAVGTSRCACGFGYLNPQLSADGYASFYTHAYRPMVAEERWRAGHPADLAPAVVQQFAAERGLWMGQTATRRWPARPVHAMCDVGGSTGEMADHVRAIWPADIVTVLDPNPTELAVAAAKGFQTQCVLADAAPAIPPQDIFLCAQTLDHVRDPLMVLRWMREALAPGGWLYVDVVDAQRWAGLRWRLAPEWKLDHPCYWSPASLRAALTATGWRPRLKGGYGPGHYHFALWCEGA